MIVSGLLTLLKSTINPVENEAIGPRRFAALSVAQYTEALATFVGGKGAACLQVSHLHDLSEGVTLERSNEGIHLRVSFLPLKEAPRLDKFLAVIASRGLDPAKETRTHIGEGSKVETLTLEWKGLSDPGTLQAQVNEILTLLQGPPGASIYVLGAS